MSNYIRVIPRDLFNEAKLLKCLGALYIAAEHIDNETLRVERLHDDTREGFDIVQCPDDGSIMCRDVIVKFHGHVIPVYTGLNSRLPYPLVAQFEDRTAYVFDHVGELTEDFRALIPEDKRR